jgi:hypothetical protein
LLPTGGAYHAQSNYTWTDDWYTKSRYAGYYSPAGYGGGYGLGYGYGGQTHP